MNPRIHGPRGQKRPRLTHDEREQIMIGTSRRESIRAIARRLGRAPSTVQREIKNNGHSHWAPGRYRARYRFGADRGGWDAKSKYSARLAQRRSEQRARRPKTGKLGRCEALREQVQALLVKHYSPAQIAAVLAATYPDRPEMQVSHETIYQALYVQGRGELRRELTKRLRTGRALRKPRKRTRAAEVGGRIPGMVNISERPAEAQDRAVPGHWEGDLIIGKDQASQIGTLVERSTGYVRLLHLPHTRTAEVVADAMIAAIKELPPPCAARDLGPRPRNGSARPNQHRRRHRGVLLRPPLTVAARQQREHQRPFTPVLPEGHRSLGAHRPTPRLRRRRTQRPTPKTLRLG